MVSKGVLMTCLRWFGHFRSGGNLFSRGCSCEKPCEPQQNAVAAGKGVILCFAAIAAGLILLGGHRIQNWLRSGIHGMCRRGVAKEEKIAKRPEILP